MSSLGSHLRPHLHLIWVEGFKGRLNRLNNGRENELEALLCLIHTCPAEAEHTHSRTHTHIPWSDEFFGCLDCRNAVKLISKSARWLLNWSRCIRHHQCECMWFCLWISVCIVAFIACVRRPMSEFTARRRSLPEPTLHKLILILKGDFLLPPTNSMLQASFWPFFFTSDTFSAFSRTVWLFSLCYFLLFSLSSSHRSDVSPLIFCLFDFPQCSPFLFLAIVSVHILCLSLASSSDLHLLQHIFTHLQFASSVSPAEFSQLPFPLSGPTYHRAHNNTVLSHCVGWKHTHTHIHVQAPASGAYQSLALIGQ